MRNLPHLNYLRSFEASARLLSFTAAAVELNLTQAAVSGHVRALEQYIGGALFNRHPRSLTLTSLGNAYLPSMQQALTTVEKATDAILNRTEKKKVVVSCPVSLASHWLPEILAPFGAEHPEVSISIHDRVWQEHIEDTTDILISRVHEETLAKEAICLWQEKLTIVCRPDYTVAGHSLCAPKDLLEARLIHILGRANFWNDILGQLGLGVQTAKATTHTSAFATALSLAIQGHGVAVTPAYVARDYIDDGRLIAPFGEAFPSPWYCTMSDQSLLSSDGARKLHQFILEAAQL